MSAKNAPGEVKENPNFDSPNITTAEEEEQQAINAEEEARKKAETVDIDGIPIDEKDISYKASDISKKGKAEYFVNVEGAEQRKKEAEKKAKIEAEEDAKAQKRAERVMKEIKAEEEARQKRVDKERKKKDQYLDRLEHRREKREKREKTAGKIKYFFFGKWHKFVTIFLILLTIGGVIFFAGTQYVDYEQKKEEQEYQAKIDALNNEIAELREGDGLVNNKEQILKDIIELDDLQKSVDSSMDVMNWAAYYNENDLFNEYQEKCRERGGCIVDEGGRG